MRIAICDDSQIDREIIMDLLHTYMTERSVPNTVTEYENGMNLIYDIEEGYYYDIVFLDILMDQILGMDIARKLRSAGYTGNIVFLTSTAAYAVDSYEVEASGYLLKPHDYGKLCTLLNRIIDRTKIGQYQVSVRNTIYSIPLGEIVYVESRNNVCILHCSNGREYTIYKKLSEIETQLGDSRFLRCHQSYLVNMSYIAKADKQFELTTGDVVLIRQRNQKEIRSIYQAFASKGIKV
jgi:DNA-binding LytR/AlgR family response regulator